MRHARGESADRIPAVSPAPARGLDPWQQHMRRGEFTAAWAISDDVLRRRRIQPCWHQPRHEQWIWRGQPLRDRRVLIRCYHGLGDTVQFIRFMDLEEKRVRQTARLFGANSFETRFPDGHAGCDGQARHGNGGARDSDAVAANELAEPVEARIGAGVDGPV